MTALKKPAQAGTDPLPPSGGGSFIWNPEIGNWTRQIEEIADQPNAASAEPLVADHTEEMKDE